MAKKIRLAEVNSFPQISYLTEAALSEEFLTQIFSYLSEEHVIQCCSCVSWKWRRAAKKSLVSFTVRKKMLSMDALQFGLSIWKIVGLTFISGTSCESLTPLQFYPTHISSLNLYGIKLLDNNLFPLAHCPKLRTLGIIKSSIADFVPLSYCFNLTTLDLSESLIEDLTPIGKLEKLESLFLNGTKIVDLSPLSSLNSLQIISLSHSNISEISPLCSLTNLKVLHLSFTQVENLNGIDGCTSLEVLNLSETPISSISPLSNCLSLKNLDLSFSLVNDISPLLPLTLTLTYISLTGAPVQNLHLLKGLSVRVIS